MGDRDRLRWRCRRGLLELDLVLNGFLERELDRLDPEQREILGELLEHPDNDLLEWVLGRSEPSDARCREMIRLIRALRSDDGRINLNIDS